MKHIFDVVIVGMGPAGLAAAAKLEDSGLCFAILDSGKTASKRDRYDATDATSGNGGAGLFSDGKFSFFPSATELWTLEDQNALKEAYTWTCNRLGAAGLDTPPFPDSPKQYAYKGPDALKELDFVLKAYPSDYLSLEARMDLIDDMVGCIRGQIFNECHVDDVEYDAEADNFTLKVRDVSKNKNRAFSELYARRVIITTGRFGPLGNGLMNLTEHSNFRRLEVGFRIEQTSDRAFFRDMKQLDPKLRFQETGTGMEWRTFCVCRQGETVLTETKGLWTVFGRSDCPPTGRSNSGFNTLILDENTAKHLTLPVIKAMMKPDSHFELPMTGLLQEDESVTGKFDKVYGRELRLAMTKGLSRLAKKFPDLGTDENAKLIGPTLEGVGWYPKVSGRLKLLDVPAYVSGDACGLFRGIVAAMISGHYSAAALMEEMV